VADLVATCPTCEKRGIPAERVAVACRECEWKGHALIHRHRGETALGDSIRGTCPECFGELKGR
jgi:DnaJ-class molecular chaperone